MFGTQQHGPLERLKAEVDDTLDPAYDREKHIHNFFRGLRSGRITVDDWESAVSRMGCGSAFQNDDVLPSAHELLSALSETERAQLKEHYFAKLKAVVGEFPNLRDEFPEQFDESGFAAS